MCQATVVFLQLNLLITVYYHFLSNPLRIPAYEVGVIAFSSPLNRPADWQFVLQVLRFSF